MVYETNSCHAGCGMKAIPVAMPLFGMWGTLTIEHCLSATANFLKPFWHRNEALLKRACILLMVLKLFIPLAFAGKTDRLKQAKQEAEKEIKAYKAQREEQFQKRMSDVRPARRPSTASVFLQGFHMHLAAQAAATVPTPAPA